MFILFGIGVFLILLFVIVYNKIISLNNNRDNSFADIDVQLKQRFDLIPNLVETVKGYATHEKETFENIVNARNKFINSGSIDSKMEADNMLTSSLKSLFALSENYPDLKANQNFIQLQSELSDIENKIAASRRYFNSATNEYNTYIQSIPTNIIAGIIGFDKKTSFKIDNEEERKNVKVTF